MSQPTDHCPLCGAAIRPASTTCHVCDTDLTKKPEPIPKRPRRKPPSRSRIAIIVAILAIGVPLLIVGDLFLAPLAVSSSRTAFRHTPTDLTPPDAIELSTASADDLVAYFRSHLDLHANAYRDIAIYPVERKGERRIVLSRREQNRSPLHVILSVEIELTPTLRVVAVRRGLRRVSPDLAHVYFGRELQALEGASH